MRRPASLFKFVSYDHDLKLPLPFFSVLMLAG